MIRHDIVRSRLTQFGSEISAALGVHRNTVYGWSRRKAEPRLSVGLKLAKLLQIPAEDLAAFFKPKDPGT